MPLPEAYGAAGDGGSEPLIAWCSDFGDAELEALQARVLQDNLNLRAAWARIEQAEAVARQAGSARWPQLQAELGVSHGLSYVPPPIPNEARTNYIASLPASYEVDLWGKVAETVAAAELDARALRGDLEALAMTLAANVAEAWFDVVHQRGVRALLESQLALDATTLELIYLRLGHGQASAPDVLLQQQQMVASQAQLALVLAAELTAEQRLAVLLGRPPTARAGGERVALPELPPTPSIGLPADLLEQRPDVRAARSRLEAADHRVAAAIADRLPTLRISASVGVQANTLGELLDTILWSVGGQIAAPLIDGGRRSAEVDRTEAVVDERLYQYGQTLLTAMLEVEGALVSERQQVAYIAQLEEQLALAREALDLERDRYRQGTGDYLRVLTVQESLKQVERALLDAERRLLSYRVQLCRAVGGDWTRALEQPTEPVSRAPRDDEIPESQP